MINGILLLFLAYLNPGFELNTTLVDTLQLDSEQKTDIEVIRDKNDLKKVSELFGNDLELPEVYFIDEVLVVKKLNKEVDPETIKILSTKKDKDGSYTVFYTAGENESAAVSKKHSYMVLKVKPVADKKVSFKVVKVDSDDPVFVDQSIENKPAYTSIQTQPRALVFHDYFPLDNGNSWTYLRENNGSKSTVTSSIVSFTKGWSVFDNFFGKKRVALQMDLEGNLMTSSKDGIKTFYTDNVKIEKSGESFSVEAGTFNDLLVVSIPRNEKFWFKDIYARGIGLIYHEHHSPKGSSYYRLQKAKVKGKPVP